MFSFTTQRRVLRAASSLVLASGLGLLLAGCQESGPDGDGVASGGGGSGGSQGFTELRPDRTGPLSDLAALGRSFVPSFDAYEDAAARLRTEDRRYRFQRNRWSFSGGSTSYDSYPPAAARVEYAHAAGLTGAGQVVSVVDSGFRTSHEIFAGRELSFPVGLPVDDHGTAVASVLAGSSGRMIGVAPGAGLALGSFQSAATRAAAVQEAIRLGAVAQNNSWGFEVDVSPWAFDAVFASGSDYLDALRAYSGRGVVVFAVSNDAARTRSSLMEALPALRPELEPGWLAVANAVPNFEAGRLTSARLVSAGCLDAARWCLAADGGWMSARAGADTSYGFATGSSFAAPQVAGALALLAEAFPDLTPHQLRLRLLASADNGFFPHDDTVELAPGFVRGYSREFGHGFLDLRAALLPIGTPVVPAMDGGSMAAGEPIALAGSATGDAVARALAAHDVLVLDGLGTEFRMGAAALVARPVPAPLANQRLATLARSPAGPDLVSARASADMVERLPVTRLPLGPPEDRIRVELLLPAVADGASAFGLGLQVGLVAPGGSLRVGARVLRDVTDTTGLSGIGRGSTEAGSAVSAMLDLEARAFLAGSAAVTAFAQVGLSDGAEGGDLSTGPAATRFSSVGLDLRLADAFRPGDRLSMGVSVPTAVTSGSARLMLPVARTAGGIVFAPVSVDLSPSDRELRLSASYSTPLPGGWTLVAEGVHAINRGHIRGETETGAVVGLRIAF